LLHVEAGGVREQGAVERLRLVVEAAELARRGLRDPDARVVQLDVRRRLTLVQESECDQARTEKSHRTDRCDRPAILHHARDKAHALLLDPLTWSAHCREAARPDEHTGATNAPYRGGG